MFANICRVICKIFSQIDGVSLRKLATKSDLLPLATSSLTDHVFVLPVSHSLVEISQAWVKASLDKTSFRQSGA
ncbi:hypothetical protein BOO36_10555 [Vibrio navarrensis]|nr:hypothetical protein [Vibrio navarrensis]